MPKNLFISYRRSDSAPWAGRVYERLARDFDKTQIFIDVDNIPPGKDFIKTLDDQVSKCDIFLCIIGLKWLTSTNENGVRRLDEPADFVRIEIESALKRDGVTLVPVLVDGARMPTEEELPLSIRQLARQNAIELTHKSFGPEMANLLGSLDIARPIFISRRQSRPRSRSSIVSHFATLGAISGLLSGLWFHLTPFGPEPTTELNGSMIGVLFAFFLCVALVRAGLSAPAHLGSAAVMTFLGSILESHFSSSFIPWGMQNIPLGGTGLLYMSSVAGTAIQAFFSTLGICLWLEGWKAVNLALLCAVVSAALAPLLYFGLVVPLDLGAWKGVLQILLAQFVIAALIGALVTRRPVH